MKLTDKRFWIFEAMMLLCGGATACVEALNYGISLFYLIGHLIVFPLCFCIGGIATWKIAKSNNLWQLAGYTLLFSTLTYCLFHIILYPVYGLSFNSTTYWSAICSYILFSILPVTLCCYGYKRIERTKLTLHPSKLFQSGNYTEITDAHKKLNRIIKGTNSCDRSIHRLHTLLKLPVSIKFSENERRLLINETYVIADSAVSHILKECDNAKKDIHSNDKRIILPVTTFWRMIALLLIFATFFAVIIFANITELHSQILANIIWIFLWTLSVLVTILLFNAMRVFIE